METIETLRLQFERELSSVQGTSSVDQLRVKYMGRKGPIQDLMRSISQTPKENRRELGSQINALKDSFEEQLCSKYKLFLLKEENLQLKEEVVDVTLPGRRRFVGSRHILSQTLREILEILFHMGFTVQYGPDIDTDYYNFEALNFPPDHPARDMQDTFYIDDSFLLRTHTSNVQMRVMESTSPPIRIVVPGRVYRNEAVSARSHVFFHQVEGVYIDRFVTFADLLSTIDQFLQRLFSKEVKMRYRPSYFPFVEPGLEVDVSCLSCKGRGCPLCKHTGWLEVAGAGMVHPEVLKNGDIDPEKYSGYAWGLGVERVAMLRCGVRDIRLFAENDIRFLSQFSAV